ncbi:cytochrome c [Marinihelvus fidelis]|uniref:Cytochrome c n=1 Tax=Marinihelvus fidelis TaxID=2613842 RepID=A0A5N0TGE1_9GAMM|nr:di-heme-cytochrome C peroxidase [Marinihelvus fidelis]KAA9134122.1 cytochrome c [Marinihelvus fidelis]
MNDKQRKRGIGHWPGRVRRFLRGTGLAIRDEFRRFLDSPLRWLRETLVALARALFRAARYLLLLPVLLLAGLLGWFARLTLKQVWSVAWRGGLVLVAVLAIGFFLTLHWPHSEVPEIEPPGRVVYLDQGWGVGREAVDRQTYYYTPQGTGNVLRNMRYDWFVNLELPWGRQRLADPNQMRAYGFQVDTEATDANPHLLPVGFTRHFDPQLGENVLDVTCAACHTGALRVRKDDGSTVSLRIDGGQAMHAFTAANMPHFVPVLLASMTSTYLNPLKFRRFAAKVLGADPSDEAVSALHDAFGETLGALLKMGYNEKRHGLAPIQEGYGRTDALTRIANMVFGDHITASNYEPGNAPVSYPPVWDIWKFDWVQYSASVAQPMARNLGESLGVGATYRLRDRYGRPISEQRRYDTTTRLLDLHTIELALRRLRPPAWPEDLLGEIDRDKAVAGGLHFIRTCQGCHGPHPASDRQRAIEAPLKTASDPHWRMKTLGIDEIGTDPNAAVNFVSYTFDLTPTGLGIGEVREVVAHELDQQIERTLAWDFPRVHTACAAGEAPVGDGLDCQAWATERQTLVDDRTRQLDAINLAAVTNGQGLNYIGLLMKKRLYEQGGFSEAEIQDLNGFGALDLPEVAAVYKARPLAGAWSTAPYMHNGSIRNLYQVLSPQHERDTRFFIGRPDFDPRQVGLALDDGHDGGFWLDTRIDGNANTGHEFRAGYNAWREGNPPQYGAIGPGYTPAQRYEIIEYLKTHLDDPPHTPLFDGVFAGIVAQALALMPAEGEEARVPETWPEGQACNLDEYLLNHENSVTLDDATRAAVATIRARLATYFAQPDAYRCGGQTRYQRGGGET